MDLMTLACCLALEGFRVLFGPVASDGVRPWTARRGALVVHGCPGVGAHVEIDTPRRFTHST